MGKLSYGGSAMKILWGESYEEEQYQGGIAQRFVL